MVLNCVYESYIAELLGREKFNTYRFADHKEKVIDLLKRVARVSVETMKIVEAMRAERR